MQKMNRKLLAYRCSLHKSWHWRYRGWNLGRDNKVAEGAIYWVDSFPFHFQSVYYIIRVFFLSIKAAVGSRTISSDNDEHD